MKKRINKEIIVIAIISILFLMMSIVYADYLYNSNQVSFNNNNTTLTSTDVQSAIDELYNKCSNIPSVGSCPEGYECTPLNRVTYNANGGSFSGNETNDVYYSVVDTKSEVIKYSHTSNVDDTGKKNSNYGNYWTNANITGTDRGSTSQAHVITIEGASSLTVDVYYNGESISYDWVSIWSGSHPSYTASSNYSSADYVAQQLGGSQSGSYTVNGNSLTNMGYSQYTIEGDTVTFGFKSDGSGVGQGYGYYAIVKGESGTGEVTKEEGEYTIPTNSDQELRFAGWTLNQDGSGTVYQSEQEVMNSLDTENREVVLYAKYKSKYICKRATTLHTETCSQTSDYCYRDGYYASGSKGTTTITYGSLGTIGSEPSPGDAFDCDVTGNGDWERFYYVSNYFDTSTQSFDNDYYVFIYYSNTTSGTASTDAVAWYSGGNYTSNGPTTVMAQLPKTTGTNAWRDDLLKTTTRNIYVTSSSFTIPSTAKSNFSYSGYAARLLTMQELKSACPNASETIGSMSGCNYFFERTQYANSSYLPSGPWLESAYSSTDAWGVNSSLRGVSSSSTSLSSGYGARPVIEIPKSDILY